MRLLILLRRHAANIVFGFLLGVLATLALGCLFMPEPTPIKGVSSWEP